MKRFFIQIWSIGNCIEGIEGTALQYKALYENHIGFPILHILYLQKSMYYRVLRTRNIYKRIGLVAGRVAHVIQL